MNSIKTTFTRAASGTPVFSTFWMLFWAVAILDDAQRRIDERRKEREAQAKAHKPKPPAPRPF